MKHQPIDLRTGVAPPSCSDCRELRKEVQEVKDHLRFLIGQFSSFANQWNSWQQRQQQHQHHQRQPKSSASPPSSVISASSNGSPSLVSVINRNESPVGSRKRKPSLSVDTTPKTPKVETNGQLHPVASANPSVLTQPWSSLWFWSNALNGNSMAQNPLLPLTIANGASPTSPVNSLMSPQSLVNMQSMVNNHHKLVQPVSVIQSTSNASNNGSRPGPDDFVKEYVETADSPAAGEITIPVPEAYECDPDFRPVSEEQILNSVKWKEIDPTDAVVRLSKKLAEKRVFGAKLMARATVAGTNHSSYRNLPIEGIRYIESICRRVLFQGMSREDFLDHFRPAIKGLAARCRRIRHSLKPVNDDEGAINGDDDDIDVAGDGD